MKLTSTRDWLDCLIDAGLLAVDYIVKGIFWIVSQATMLGKQVRSWVRKDPKCALAIVAAPAIVYIGLGSLRCVGVLMSSGHPGVTYIPLIDWWWVGIIKLLQ